MKMAKIERPIRAASNLCLIIGLVVAAIPLGEAGHWFIFAGWTLASRVLVWFGEARMVSKSCTCSGRRPNPTTEGDNHGR